MISDEQIFEVASKHLRYFDDGWRGTEYSGEPQDLLKFAQEIRKQTIDEILTTLEKVPNPEANRIAINRIKGI